ncbi:MAG TPA: sigma-70 family RNA polymerase sigma factor [Solirubrobacteraceae bacterium]|nr:sigma-70 family RNA polymerase sigma factor [Solirubrobacteraceae bacterium]
MTVAAANEERLLARLRAGDETAFRELVTRHDRAMKRLALTFVRLPSVADEVVQETWLAVINGLDRFEGRSSLKTWIFRILANRAQSRGAREQRTTPFSSLAGSDDDGGPTADPDRFLPPGHAAAGYWSATPSHFFELPEDRLLAAETAALVAAAIEQLPSRQRQVIRLRDVEGWDADEVCACLDLSQANQRVLLHRARSAVRARLEEYFTEVVSV